MPTHKYYRYLRLVSYAAVFIGAFYGIYVMQNTGDTARAVTLFTSIGIIPLALCAFIWHSVLSGNVYSAEASTFFEYEVAGANLAIAIMLIIATYYNFGIKAICCILGVYFIYLLIAAIVHMLHNGILAALKFCPLLIILLYFIWHGLL